MRVAITAAAGTTAGPTADLQRTGKPASGGPYPSGRPASAEDMDGYQDLPHDAEHDNGGVHINSGIPNRAFALAATAIGGYAWEAAGQIWYDTITAKGVPKDIDFAGFAERTIAAAKKRFGAKSTQTKAVHDAWVTVKVLR